PIRREDADRTRHGRRPGRTRGPLARLLLAPLQTRGLGPEDGRSLPAVLRRDVRPRHFEGDARYPLPLRAEVDPATERLAADRADRRCAFALLPTACGVRPTPPRR